MGGQGGQAVRVQVYLPCPMANAGLRHTSLPAAAWVGGAVLGGCFLACLVALICVQSHLETLQVELAWMKGELMSKMQGKRGDQGTPKLHQVRAIPILHRVGVGSSIVSMAGEWGSGRGGNRSFSALDCATSLFRAKLKCTPPDGHRECTDSFRMVRWHRVVHFHSKTQGVPLWPWGRNPRTPEAISVILSKYISYFPLYFPILTGCQQPQNQSLLVQKPNYAQ